MGNVKKYVAEKAHHQRQYERRVNNRQMQTQKSKIDSGSALDVVSSQALYADLVVMESNGTESGMHDTRSSSGNCITHVVDANIRPVNDQVPFLETAGLRWIPTGNMFTDSTTKVDSEPPNGSNEDITNPYKCKQSLDVSACTLNLSTGRLNTVVQASDLNVNKMAPADNTSGLALQRKERSTLQCALSLEARKSSCLRPFSSTSFMLFHARSVIKNGHMNPGYISSGLVQNSVSPTPYVPPSKKDYEIMFQQLFDEYFNPPPRAVSPVLAAVAAPRAVDPAGSLSSTTID
nr:hypothetical protein [Tanacetum cinerariifolium]